MVDNNKTKVSRNEHLTRGLQERENASAAFDKTRSDPNTEDARVAENKFADARRKIADVILDRNGDGQISRAELQSALDPDNNGIVSAGELKKFEATLPASARKTVNAMWQLEDGVSVSKVESRLGKAVVESETAPPTDKNSRILAALKQREEATPEFNDTRKNPGSEQALIAEARFGDARREMVRGIFDANGDGLIQREEFNQKLDPNKDGRISQAEIDAFHQTIPEEARSVVDAMLRLKDGVPTKTAESWLGMSVTDVSSPTAHANTPAKSGNNTPGHKK